MNRMTITALAAVFAIAGASPVLAEGCNWTGCGKTFSIESRRTPSYGQDRTVLESIISSI